MSSRSLHMFLRAHGWSLIREIITGSKNLIRIVNGIVLITGTKYRQLYFFIYNCILLFNNINILHFRPLPHDLACRPYVMLFVIDTVFVFINPSQQD